jgi:hypothetical protein
VSHLKWDEVTKGLETTIMHRTIKVITWLSRGYCIPMAKRTVAMTKTESGLPYLVIKATCEKEGEDTTFVALGLEPDLGVIYSFVQSISDDDWDKLLVSVAATEASRRHPR